MSEADNVAVMREWRGRVRLWRWMAVVLGALALVAGAQGCGGVGSAGTHGVQAEGASGGSKASTLAAELGLAYLAPLTGDLANIGLAGRDAVQLAIDQAKASGDLPVRLALKVFDTQADPAQAQRLTVDVLGDASVVGVIGPLSSGEVKAAAPTLDDGGMPFVTVASNPDLARQGWKAFHRLIANDEIQSREVAGYIAAVLRARTVSVIHDNTEYGKGLATLTTAALRDDGVNVEIDVIDPKALDYSAAVNGVKARRPDVVFYGGYYPEAGRLVKQLRDAGMAARFVSGDASKDPGIGQGGGKAAEGVQATCACADPALQQNPAAQSFIAAYQERFGRPPQLYSAEMYDGATVLIDAIRRGAHTRQTVLENLKSGHVTGVTKTFSFRPDGEVGAGSVYVYEFRAGAFTSLGTTTDLAR
ncbi:MAG: branched-chain amino acid transport system substrate-binding protein [Actinomycetota bacterium]|nr:branched-chain amino acid transport system substrate-binding protein [Actinomycetota bacterium]